MSRVTDSRRFAHGLMSALIVVLFAACGSFCADADVYPSRAVRVVIPYSPGGSPDVIFRIVAQDLSIKWKQPIVVENRGGGNTIPGTLLVSRAPADGYTLLCTTDGTFLLNPLIFPNLPYSMSDLTPVLLIATAPHMVAVSKGLNVNSVAEFVALAKKEPNGLRYGSTGSMSLQRLAMEQFAHVAGIKLVQIPYKGAPETTTAILSGEIAASVNGIATVLPLLKAGNLGTIGVASRQRSLLAPDVPTLQEQGIENVTSQGMFGLFAPANLPQDIREKIRDDILEVTSRPTIKAALEARGYEIRSEGLKEFKALIAAESGRWQKIMLELNNIK